MPTIRNDGVKRKAGRPKGTTRLPRSYWLAVLQAVDEVRRKGGLSIEAACRAICANGGLKWVAPDYQPTGQVGMQTRAQITDARVLSNRYHEARARVGDVPANWRVPRHRLTVFRYTGGREGRLRKTRMKSDWVFMPNVIDSSTN